MANPHHQLRNPLPHLAPLLERRHSFLSFVRVDEVEDVTTHELTGAVAEHMLDGWAIVEDDPAGIDDGDDVVHAAEERLEIPLPRLECSRAPSELADDQRREVTESLDLPIAPAPRLVIDDAEATEQAPIGATQRQPRIGNRAYLLGGLVSLEERPLSGIRDHEGLPVCDYLLADRPVERHSPPARPRLRQTDGAQGDIAVLLDDTD